MMPPTACSTDRDDDPDYVAAAALREFAGLVEGMDPDSEEARRLKPFADRAAKAAALTPKWRADREVPR